MNSKHFWIIPSWGCETLRIGTILCFFFLASSATIAQTKEIPQSTLRSLEDSAESLLKAYSYRLTTTLEYFQDRNQSGVVTHSLLREVQLPDKRREVEEETVSGKKRKEESIWADKVLYVRVNDGEWKKYSGGSGTAFGIEQGRVTTTCRFLGKELVDGVQTDKYEMEQHRFAKRYSPSSPTGTVEVHYVRRTLEWFLPDGRLLKKQVDNEILGQKDLTREISVYDFDPKLNIQAPIK